MTNIENAPQARYGFQQVHETMTNFKDYLRSAELPEEYVIFGGANLVLRGIKAETRDIDMLVSDSLFHIFKNHPKSKIKEPPIQARLLGADNKTVEPQLSCLSMPVSLTTHIGDGWFPMSYFRYPKENRIENFLGNNLVPLDDVWQSKLAIQRPSDLLDLELIARATRRSLSEIPEPKTKIFQGFMS